MSSLGTDGTADRANSVTRRQSSPYNRHGEGTDWPFSSASYTPELWVLAPDTYLNDYNLACVDIATDNP
jgi:hypothetical protein